MRNLRDTLLNVVTGGDLLFTNIEPTTLVNVLNETNSGGSVDFSSILLMAYVAYASQKSKRAIPLLAAYAQDRFAFVPFDLKILLALSQAEPQANLQFTPPFPMLTLGWSLLQATHESLPEDLVELPQHYRNASWTHFDSSGVALCRSYLEHQQGSRARGQGGMISFGVAEPVEAVELVDASLWFEHPARIASHHKAFSSLQQAMTTQKQELAAIDE